MGKLALNKTTVGQTETQKRADWRDNFTRKYRVHSSGEALIKGKTTEFLPDPDSVEGIELRISEFEEHINETVACFNEFSEELGLGVTVSGAKLLRDLRNGRNLRMIGPDPDYSFFEGSQFGGRIWPNQLYTGLVVFKELIQNPLKFLLILGALQSGKTGTGLALQFFGPIYYLLTGIKVFPLYLVTNFQSHEAQTLAEFKRFLEFYGHLEFSAKKKCCTLLDYVDAPTIDAILGPDPVLPSNPQLSPRFQMAPSLMGYRDNVIKRADKPLQYDRAEVAVRRRVRGRKSMDGLTALIQRILENGYVPLPIYDEYQHGASSPTDDKLCVLAQVKERIEEVRCNIAKLALASTGQKSKMLKLASKVRGVLLSATPYGVWDMQEVIKVEQRLPMNYQGFNMFMGERIDSSVPVRTPKVLTVAEMTKQTGIDFLRFVDMPFYFKHKKGNLTGRAFRKWAAENGYLYDSDQPFEVAVEHYCAKVERALRQLIYALAERSGNGGMCFRFVNNNELTDNLLARLKLDPRKIQRIDFYRNQGQEGSVKALIMAQRKDQGCDLPYLIVVTNKARMGDSFPVEVKYFGEMTGTAGDMNALLQGLLGRSCGAGKDSTVIMSQSNVEVVRSYINSLGLPTKTPSRHAPHMMDAIRHGKRHVMAKLQYGIHKKIDAFMDDVNKHIVEKVLHQGVPKLTKIRSTATQEVPLYALASKHRLLEFLEANPGLLFPGIEGELKIARPDDKLKNPKPRHLRKNKADPDWYTFIKHPTKKGWVFVGFRTNGENNNRFHRIRGGGRGDKRTIGFEPQINVEKFDPKTRQNIMDKCTPGNYRANLVTLPLLAPAQITPVGSKRVMVNHRHALDHELTGCERLERETKLVGDAITKAERAKRRRTA